MRNTHCADCRFVAALLSYRRRCAGRETLRSRCNRHRDQDRADDALQRPLSVYGQIGRAQLAYFAMINAEGGINGRKITLISLDDGYMPAKALEQVRKLVEQDEVLLIFNSVGTATNIVVRNYLNGKKVPHLFVAGGDAVWGDYKHYPVDHGLGRQLSGGGPLIRRAHPGEPAEREDRYSRAQRRLRARLCEGLQGWPGERASTMIVGE